MTHMNNLRSVVLAAACLASAAAHAEIVIGVAGPMSGQYAAGGEQMRRGVLAAVEQLNAAGGILGQKVRVEVGDDACDPKQAVAVANTLVNKKINVIVGHYCSSSTIPASEVYSEAQIPMITISTNGLVTDRGLKNIFRITGRDDQEGAVAANWMAAKFPGTKVAIVDDKSAFGKGQADVVERVLGEQKIKPVLRTSITAGEKDYSALISKLKASGAETVFYGGYHIELGLILRQGAQSGLKVNMVSGNTSTNSELLSAAGDAVNGLVFTFYPDPRKHPASAEVVQRFRANKIEPDGYVLFTYAAVQLYAQAAAAAKSVAFGPIQKALAAGSFDTVIGNIGFDAKGDPKKPSFLVYQWKGNKYDLAQ